MPKDKKIDRPKTQKGKNAVLVIAIGKNPKMGPGVRKKPLKKSFNLLKTSKKQQRLEAFKQRQERREQRLQEDKQMDEGTASPELENKINRAKPKSSRFAPQQNQGGSKTKRMPKQQARRKFDSNEFDKLVQRFSLGDRDNQGELSSNNKQALARKLNISPSMLTQGNKELESHSVYEAMQELGAEAKQSRDKRKAHKQSSQKNPKTTEEQDADDNWQQYQENYHAEQQDTDDTSGASLGNQIESQLSQFADKRAKQDRKKQDEEQDEDNRRRNKEVDAMPISETEDAAHQLRYDRYNDEEERDHDHDHDIGGEEETMARVMDRLRMAGGKSSVLTEENKRGDISEGEDSQMRNAPSDWTTPHATQGEGFLADTERNPSGVGRSTGSQFKTKTGVEDTLHGFKPPINYDFGRVGDNPLEDEEVDMDEVQDRMEQLQRGNPMDIAFRLLKMCKGNDSCRCPNCCSNEVQDKAFTNQCHECGALIPSGQERNHVCREKQ